MLGSIIGDIVGSRFEHTRVNSMTFPLFTKDCRFTDDTVLTVAIYYSLKNNIDLIDTVKKFSKKYFDAGFGPMFLNWVNSTNRDSYGSYGNGAAMRVSGVIEFSNNLEEILELADNVSSITHDEEGCKGARAIASAIFLAKEGKDKEYIRKYIQANFYKNLDLPFAITCRTKETVPLAIKAFLDSSSFEDALRRAINMGTDTDTIACMTGGIAEYYYGIPEKIKNEAVKYLDKNILNILGGVLNES